MGCGFDPEKGGSNLAKHGVDLNEAQKLRDDSRLAVVEARSDDEQRFVAIGRIGDRHRSAVFALRLGTVRLISVRRARAEEIERYEGR